MKRRLKRTADHSAGEALIAGRRGVVEGTPPRGPQWGNDGNIKVGAYLMMHVIGDDGLRLSSESASWAALDRGSGGGGGGASSSLDDDAAAAAAEAAASEGAEDESLVPFAYGDTDGRAEADAADDPHVQWIDDAGPSICRMKKVAGKAPAGRGGAVKYVDSWFVEAHPDFAKTVLTGEVGTLAQRLRPEEEPMLAPPLVAEQSAGAAALRPVLPPARRPDPYQAGEVGHEEDLRPPRRRRPRRDRAALRRAQRDGGDAVEDQPADVRPDRRNVGEAGDVEPAAPRRAHRRPPPAAAAAARLLPRRRPAAAARHDVGGVRGGDTRAAPTATRRPRRR